MTVINEAEFVDSAALIQMQLAKAGIKMNINIMEYTAVSAMTLKPLAEWQGNAVLHRITPPRGTVYDATYYQYGADARGQQNYGGYNRTPGAMNARAEAIMNQLDTLSDYVEADRAKMLPLTKELSQLIMNDEPRLRLTWYTNVDVVASYVMGLELEGTDMYNQMKNVWLNK